MLGSAVDALLAAYDRDADIEHIRKIKQDAAEKINIFSEEGLASKREYAEKLKPDGEADAAEILRYTKACAEYDMFKLYHETYSRIYENPEQEQKLNKNMQKELNRIKKELKAASDFYEAFKGVQMELKGV